MTDPEELISAKQAHALVQLGKSCSNYAYPNPDRVGCPDDFTLRAMAFRDPAIPMSELPISHVVSCTPCYRTYCGYRKQAVWRNRFEYAAVSMGLVAVLLVALWIARGFWTRTAEPSMSVNVPNEQRKSPPPAPLPNDVKPPQRRAQAPDGGTATTTPLLVKAALDLRDQSIPRNDDPAKTKSPSQVLPRAFIDLTAQLPFASPPGEYQAGVFHLDQRPIVRALARAEIQDGITLLKSRIDLSGVQAGRRLFGVKRRDGDWVYSEITIR
jgi:hypothetical protein